MSRVTSRFLVMIDTAWRNSASTDRHRRVSPSRRSSGWYGSVTPLRASTRGCHLGDASSARKSSGASSLTRIFVSKSRPAE